MDGMTDDRLAEIGAWLKGHGIATTAAELHGEVVRLRSDLAATIAHRNAALRDREAMAAKYDDAKQTLRSYLPDFRPLDANLGELASELGARLRRAEDELAGLRSRLRTAERDLSIIRDADWSARDTAEAKLRDAETALAAASSDLADVMEQRDNLRARMAEHRQRAERLSVRLDELEAAHNAANRAHRAAQSAAREIGDQLRAELARRETWRREIKAVANLLDPLMHPWAARLHEILKGTPDRPTLFVRDSAGRDLPLITDTTRGGWSFTVPATTYYVTAGTEGSAT